MSGRTPVHQVEEIALIRRLQEAVAAQEAGRARRLADRLEQQRRELEELVAADQSSWLATVGDGPLQLSQATAWSRQILTREDRLRGLVEERQVALSKAATARESWGRAQSRERAAEATAARARRDERRRHEGIRQSDLEDQRLMRLRPPCA